MNEDMQMRIDQALLSACREAAKALGGDIKSMSCFVSNWPGRHAKSAEDGA